MPLLSIVIPAFDEEQRIGKTLDATLDYLDCRTTQVRFSSLITDLAIAP